MKITREEISDTAVKLFLDKGYNNVTIQDICNELNITKPTLYKYISNKEDLILDLYDSTIDHLVKDTYKLVDSDSHYQQLLIVFSTLIKDTKKYGYDLFSQMFIANLKENRNSFAMRESLTKLCIIIIKKAQKNKEIHNLSNPEFIYQALAHTFTGHEALWCIKKEENISMNDEVLGGGNLFFNYEKHEYQTSSVSCLYGVKNGQPYELQISGKYMNFRIDENRNKYIAEDPEYNEGQQYEDIFFEYDENIEEFYKITN